MPFNGNRPGLFTTGPKEKFKRNPANLPSNHTLKPNTSGAFKKRTLGSGGEDEPTPSSSAKKAKTEMTQAGPINNTPLGSSTAAQVVPDAVQSPGFNNGPSNNTNKNKSQVAQRQPERKRKPSAKKVLPSRQIPSSLDEASEEDRQLLGMRDAGTDWKAIRAKWEELTGETTGVSTLPNRYARLKESFTVIREEDHARLLEAKREVEESFENQKWDLVARVVQEKGGDGYAGVVLQRGYKKMMTQGMGVAPPAGVRDPDFEIESLEEGEEADE
ncbi:Hypothetical predicted protein [Lecanosticta acicola]|uniref:Myb-like domain-containing protein n=1 Tax=Lecanosticta acicola TaxID=111012 RepID=A0AAI8YXD0_9PEZI|nr:Hypothetical predicted protein [Lecanosticta acicola]